MDDDKILAVLERLEVGQHELRHHVDQRFQRLEDQMVGLERGIVGLSGRMRSLEERVSGLENRMTGLEHRMTGFDQRLDQFRVVVMDRFGKLEDRSTGVLDNISVNLGAVGHVRRRQENDREEMRMQ